MNNILWTQGASSDQSSTFVIDGTVVCDSNLTGVAYEKLCQMDKSQTMHKKVVDIFYKMGIIPSRQFKLVCKKGDGIFFKSVYKSQDDQGRHIAYMFYNKTNDIKQTFDSFVEFSKLANRQVWGEEFKVLKFLFKLKTYSVLIVIIAVIIISLWKIFR